MYVCEWHIGRRNFCNFSLVTKNVESRSKTALFSNERHFEIWFPKKKTITFFWSKLSKLHEKDPILHMTTTFSLKQGETRTNSLPIPHPLNIFEEPPNTLSIVYASFWKHDINYLHQLGLLLPFKWNFLATSILSFGATFQYLAGVEFL